MIKIPSISDDILELMRDFPEGLSVSQIQRELANRLDLRSQSLGQARGSVPGINPVRYKLRQLRKFGCVDYVFSGRTKIWFLPENKKTVRRD